MIANAHLVQATQSHRSNDKSHPDLNGGRGLKVVRQRTDAVDPRVNDLALIGYLRFNSERALPDDKRGAPVRNP